MSRVVADLETDKRIGTEKRILTEKSNEWANALQFYKLSFICTKRRSMMKPDSPLRKFDPRKLAHYEKENYVAYYQKDWLKLLRVSVRMVKESFGLTWLQAAYAAYLVARAEIAFAPFPDNDVPLAVAYMQRFYQFIKNVHHEDYDVARAAKLELNWWIVHRKLFGNTQNDELVQALAGLYAEAYGVDVVKVRPAASLRAQGMLCSDLWVNAGKPAASPLLAQEEEALYKSYLALKDAIGAS
jgi:hypothetical protein